MGWYDQVQVQAPQASGYGVASQLMSESNKGIQDAIKTGGNFFANKAIGELMKNKPSGTEDPTKHIADISGYMGYLSPEQAAAYRDYGAALQTSYGRNLEQGRFDKQIAQAEDHFGRKLTQDEKLALAQNQTSLKVAGMNNAATLGVAKMNIDSMKEVRQGQALQNTETALGLANKNEMLAHPEGVLATVSRSGEIVNNYRSKPTPFEQFKVNVKAATPWYQFWNSSNDESQAYNLANKLLNTVQTTPEGLRKQAAAKALLESGGAGGNMDAFMRLFTKQ